MKIYAATKKHIIGEYLMIWKCLSYTIILIKAYKIAYMTISVLKTCTYEYKGA